MEDIMMTILNALVPTIIALLGGAITWLTVKVKKAIDEKSRNETVKAVINDTVKYIEQVYKDIHGPDKLNQAKTIALNWLTEKGIKIGDAELTILIESAVNGLK